MIPRLEIVSLEVTVLHVQVDLNYLLECEGDHHEYKLARHIRNSGFARSQRTASRVVINSHHRREGLGDVGPIEAFDHII